MNYLELSWPSLPGVMEAELLKLCLLDNEDCSEIYKNSKTLFQSDKEKRTFIQIDAPDYLKEWVKQNLKEINDEYTIQLQIWQHSDYGVRHIDKRREYSYNYLLMEHPGITRWFENDGTFIESVNYQHKKWYKHIGSLKYHDVLHVNNFRPAVTIYKRVVIEDSERPLFWSMPANLKHSN